MDRVKERAGTLSGRRSAIARALLALSILAGCSPALPAETMLSPGSSPGSAPTVAPRPSPSPSAIAISRDRAIALAREALPRRAADSVLEAELGPFSELGTPEAPVRRSPAPAPEHLVWRINLGTVRGPLNADGSYVVIDATDGMVLQTIDWIS